jgi:hypothetical protein
MRHCLVVALYFAVILSAAKDPSSPLLLRVPDPLLFKGRFLQLLLSLSRTVLPLRFVVIPTERSDEGSLFPAQS